MMVCPAVAPVLKYNPVQKMPNMYAKLQDMLGFKVAEFTRQVTEPYLRDRSTGKDIMYIDSKGSALVRAFTEVAGMRPLDAKQAGDLYHSARTAPYCKYKRPNLLTTCGVTAGRVRCTADGFADNDFEDIKQEDVVVKSLRPAIHLTDARGTTYASTCPANLVKCWNAAGIKPKITKSGLTKMLRTITADGGVYLRLRVEVKAYCSTSGAKWLGGREDNVKKRKSYRL
jgi:hypothetical protein